MGYPLLRWMLVTPFDSFVEKHSLAQSDVGYVSTIIVILSERFL